MFGKDPFEPVKRSYIPDIINEQSCITVRCVQSGEKNTGKPERGFKYYCVRYGYNKKI